MSQYPYARGKTSTVAVQLMGNSCEISRDRG